MSKVKGSKAAPAPAKGGAFDAKAWASSGVPEEEVASIKQAYEKTLPLGRVCQPADIADGILSLITGSRLVTGQTLTVDAGMMISGFQVKFD